jgi:hypothetical protein
MKEKIKNKNEQLEDWNHLAQDRVQEPVPMKRVISHRIPGTKVYLLTR